MSRRRIISADEVLAAVKPGALISLSRLAAVVGCSKETANARVQDLRVLGKLRVGYWKLSAGGLHQPYFGRRDHPDHGDEAKPVVRAARVATEAELLAPCSFQQRIERAEGIVPAHADLARSRSAQGVWAGL